MNIINKSQPISKILKDKKIKFLKNNPSKFQYFIRHVYGVPTKYPVGEKFENFVAQFGKKTVTIEILKALEILGIQTEQIMEPVYSGGVK